MKKLILFLLLIPTLSLGQSLKIKDIIDLKSSSDFIRIAIENSFSKTKGVVEPGITSYHLEPTYYKLSNGRQMVDDYSMKMVWATNKYKLKINKRDEQRIYENEFKMVEIHLNFSKNHYDKNYQIRQKWLNYLKSNCSFQSVGKVNDGTNSLTYECGLKYPYNEVTVYEIDRWGESKFQIVYDFDKRGILKN